jgi:MoxR-like ATPase
MTGVSAFTELEGLSTAMARHRYIADETLSTVLILAYRLKRPVFLEGEPGVGKTELARVISEILSTKLIRLQCYEGLDASQALYEWNYPKQLLQIKMAEACNKPPEEVEDLIYDESFLIKRPLFEAIRYAPISSTPFPVLLIDELDRADEAFEALLLEILSDFQISIPELGTLRCDTPPFVIITSNRTRDIHDAVKRRCLYHWIDYPDFEKEVRIVRARIPGIDEVLLTQVVRFLQTVRKTTVFTTPGVSETIDWALALVRLNRARLDPETVEKTLGCIFKHHTDREEFKNGPLADEETRKRLFEP